MLEWEDVDPNKAGEDGSVPLLLAACDGQEVVVKLLLGRDDVNLDTLDKNGQGPL